MSLSAYLRSSWPQLVLVAAMATCLGLQAVQCMHIAPETAGNAGLATGVCGGIVAWLHLATRDRRSIAIGVPLLAALCLAAGLATSGGDLAALFADSYDNALLVFPVLVATAALVFVLTRKQATSIVLGLGGCVFCGAVEFLYLQHLYAPTLGFMVACAAYLACRRALAFAGDDLAASFQASKLACSLGLALVAAALACGAFFLVVAPLDPPVHELKLITRYYSLEEVHVSGYSEYLHQKNENLDSKNTSDQEKKTDQSSEESRAYRGQSQAKPAEDRGDQGGGGTTPFNIGAPASLVRYFRDSWWLWLLVPIAVVGIWAGIVALRRHRRRARLGRWQSLEPRMRVLAEYRYLRSVLENVCKVAAAGLTPAEYASAARAETESLERTGESVGFDQVSALAAKAAYGGPAPRAEELVQVEGYLALVPTRVLHRFGRRRYLRLFFRV